MEEIKRRQFLTVSHLHPTDPEVCSDEINTLVPDYNGTNSIMCLDPNVGTNPCQVICLNINDRLEIIKNIIL